MLVLTRRLNESIFIGDDITVTVVRIGPSAVRIGIVAPADVTVNREEVALRQPELVREIKD